MPEEKWPMDRWIDQIREEAIEPDMEIIDPHHHLWDPLSHPKGWPIGPFILRMLYLQSPAAVVEFVNNGAKAKCEKGDDSDMVTSRCYGKRQLPFLTPYMGPEFLYDIDNRGSKNGGHNIVKTVYLECGWFPRGVEEALQPVGEVNMVLSVRTEHPRICQGIVAHANLTLPDVAKTLDAYAKVPAVKGIRHSLAHADDAGVNSHSPKDLARSEEFKRGFALLQKHGFTYDTWMYHEQIPSVTDLVSEFPDIVVIINHVAQPLGIGSYKAEKTFSVWEVGMRQLARASRNVHVKLSGLGMCHVGFHFDEQDKPPSSAELAKAWEPYFKVCIEAFGVDRCFFASNFPVDKVSCDYTVLWNAFKLFARNFSDSDKRKLFYANAQRIYRL